MGCGSSKLKELQLTTTTTQAEIDGLKAREKFSGPPPYIVLEDADGVLSYSFSKAHHYHARNPAIPRSNECHAL